MEVLHFSAQRSGGRRAEDSGPLLWRRQRPAGQPQGRAGVFDRLRKLFIIEFSLLLQEVLGSSWLMEGISGYPLNDVLGVVLYF